MFNQVLSQNMIDACIFKTLCALDDSTEGRTPLWLNPIARFKHTFKATIHFIFDHHVVKKITCKPNVRNCIKIPLSWRILDDCLDIVCRNLPKHPFTSFLIIFWSLLKSCTMQPFHLGVCVLIGQNTKTWINLNARQNNVDKCCPWQQNKIVSCATPPKKFQINGDLWNTFISSLILGMPKNACQIHKL